MWYLFFDVDGHVQIPNDHSPEHTIILYLFTIITYRLC